MGKPNAQYQQEVMRSLGQAAAAWLVGMSPRKFRDTDAPRSEDGTYNARELVEWLSEKSPADADEMLVGNDSPALERYRLARAKLAEMDEAERSGRLVDMEQFVEWFATEVGTPIRRAIETLEARYGESAAVVMSKAIDKAEGAIAKRGDA